MKKAYVFINTKNSNKEETLNQIKQIDGVIEAYTTLGVYDGIIKIQAETFDELHDNIWKIRKTHNLASTLCLTIIDDIQNV